MKRNVILAILSCVALFAQPTKDQAQASATAWLTLLDNNQLDENWADMATFLRNAPPEFQGSKIFVRMRNEVGLLPASRRFDSVTLIPAIKDLPAGQYAEVHFVSTFSKTKEEGIEEVRLFFEDGKWRPISYGFLKKESTPNANRQ